MEKLSEHLINLADKLDKSGNFKSADAVDLLFRENSLEKVAQYVGAIGYVLKQNRAMSNCIRKKRVANSGSMQEVIFDCLKEYQDGQDYDDKTWTSKYAQTIKQSPENFHQLHLAFLSQLGAENKISEHIELLHKTAQTLREEGHPDETIDQILEHVDALGELLAKETSL